jgi:hypothetical protein
MPIFVEILAILSRSSELLRDFRFAGMEVRWAGRSGPGYVVAVGRAAKRCQHLRIRARSNVYGGMSMFI